MNFANEFDIESWVRKYATRNLWDTPNLARGANTLDRLATWANDNSDGWCYWPKPCRAANKLITLLSEHDGFEPGDVTDQELTKALTPIKAFLTRQGVTHSEVIV